MRLTSHSLVEPSLEKEANMELSGSTRILGGRWAGLESHAARIVRWTNQPVDSIPVVMDVGYQLAFGDPPARTDRLVAVRETEGGGEGEGARKGEERARKREREIWVS